MAVLLPLGPGPLQGDHHVSQGQKAGLRVGVGVVCRRLAGNELEHREAEHVGGPVHLPLLQVDLVDARVVGEEHVHLAGDGHPLGLQGRRDDPAEQLLPGAGILLQL